jgi:hypothetical protein
MRRRRHADDIKRHAERRMCVADDTQKQKEKRKEPKENNKNIYIIFLVCFPKKVFSLFSPLLKKTSFYLVKGKSSP